MRKQTAMMLNLQHAVKNGHQKASLYMQRTEHCPYKVKTLPVLVNETRPLKKYPAYRNGVVSACQKNRSCCSFHLASRLGKTAVSTRSCTVRLGMVASRHGSLIVQIWEILVLRVHLYFTALVSKEIEIHTVVQISRWLLCQP